MALSLSRRAYGSVSPATSWEEIWEAANYYHRISELLEDAKEYAIFSGWQIDSRLRMRIPERPPKGAPGFETLKQKIIRLCDAKPGFRIYFIMWDHAYLYLIERELWQGRIWDQVHPRVHFVFDNRHPLGASHHEKLVIIDGRVALCGGIDLCDERWDSHHHFYEDPRRSLDWKKERHGPYHDLAVQVAGSVCGALHSHVAQRWKALSSIPFPEPKTVELRPEAAKDAHRVFVSRTFAPPDSGPRPRLIREIEFLFRELIQSAEHRLILEGQYFWSAEINELLIAKMLKLRERLTLVLVLADLQKVRSLTRAMAPYQLGLLSKLKSAADFCGTKLVLGKPYSSPDARGDAPGDSNADAKPGAKPIYVHSKILIADDRYLCVGSANLATRALRADTEIALTLEARSEAEKCHVRRIGEQVLEHWGISLEATRRPRLVSLRPILPETELKHLPRDLERTRRWRWEILFDPKLPFIYRARRKFQLLPRRYKLVRAGSIAALCLVSAWASVWVSTSAQSDERMLAEPFLFALALSSSWIIPVPYFWISALACLSLGETLGTRLAVASFLIAAPTGYFVSRVFPDWASRAFRAREPAWLPERVGLRDFRSLLVVLADPRLPVSLKFAYQGLFFIPMPWFILGTCLFLPGLLYLFCREAVRLIPAGFFAELVFLIAILTIAQVFIRKWKRST